MYVDFGKRRAMMLGMSFELADGEQIAVTRLAGMAQGHRAPGGRLFLTNQRLAFRARLIDRIVGARDLSVPRAAIMDVSVAPRRSGFFTGGFRHRIVVRIRDGSEHYFVVNRPRAVAAALRAELDSDSPR